MLLAIDSSTGTSVAVVDRDGGILAERTITDTMSHAEVVGSSLREVMQEAGVEASALSGVACGMGPGPFTGLRIGIAAARVFALATGKPLVPLVSHDAVAFDKYRSGHTGGLLVVTDARRRELYWSAYSGADQNGIPVRVEGPGLSKPNDLGHADLVRVDATTVSAGALGMLGELLYATGGAFAADEALYLRSPDAVPSTGAKRVTA
ncbi:tRNA (adenosine(37)-N6)-threonylcarbamoyltransferase complex dimerization subunit type 1 TsaB [Mycetocola zhadangensis]|uniref:tRNA (Adenosine(37)-N6)-threonylcarbamoyltransferase complex dimerization subunit type 1 TsaB n=1 Tax=Mycetocola zhadangensis TaxID=1164595 RepID=A0A3L7J443_9MICO|nr:tRNA (adenosine(37)-N6)-threonylcarbamoyltransferase complex dimerization subunit type 1 TsaB [Mycetocola zhadangensis]RLQ85436.1 tRNA (adenosine(37)-N6)-threonylcarbamoyltransferase complex dimerization subunit type 1 TsaB [Mycetocola zhadangensis]GGE82547.1 tRNA (adenosine(37)-N6)-threonylcarbamoyltransferase complex dimerization subunit type 1 TsaB [Mycetocola zhadangensis]